MVRNIVGTLMDVQREADPERAMQEILESETAGRRVRPRRLRGFT